LVWDWADNTYSDGAEVVNPGPGDNRTDAQRATQAAWPYNEFCLGGGAVQDMPYGNESVIAKPPAAGE
jgi:cytochrome c1